MSNKLTSGQQFARGESLVSINGKYKLTLQDDGNLVVIKDNDYSNPLWSSHTNGKAIQFCKMREDGNLVLNDYNTKPCWKSNTQGHTGAELVVQDDGNVVIYWPGPIWETNTETNT